MYDNIRRMLAQTRLLEEGHAATSQLKGKLLLAIIGLIVGSGLIICSLVAYRYTQALYAAAATHAENLSHQIALQAAEKS